LRESAVPLNQVIALLASKKSRKGVIFVDAMLDPAQVKIPQGSRIAMMSGGSFGGFVIEDTTLRHGVFTNFLVAGLEGGAADDDGLIATRGLFRYISQKMAEHGGGSRPAFLELGVEDFPIVALELR
jgi:hypothetical protein